MWTEPKTDWNVGDKFNYSDYNRIKNNIEYLKERAKNFYLDFPFDDMGSDKQSYTDIPYADEFMNLESNLESIKQNTFQFYSSDRKYWYENQSTPTWQDFNRLENACLDMKNGFDRQESSLTRLYITFGTRQSDIRI